LLNIVQIGEVFRNLLDKGQRDHLKGFIRICNSELNDAKYQSIRNYIFGNTGLSARNFEELCKVLAMIFDLRKFKNEAVDKIIVRIVASLEECLINNSFTVEVAKDLNVSDFFQTALLTNNTTRTKSID
jgi:transcription elongation factor GreA-like protein